MPSLRLLASLAALALFLLSTAGQAQQVRYYDLPKGGRPHDVAADPAPGGPVWYTAQRSGHLGKLDPATGKVELIPLGEGSAPHGVIVGPDGAPWVTDGGLNAIVRVDQKDHAVRVLPLPASHPRTNLNTLVFDKQGNVWFTGQNGIYGRADPKTGEVKVWDAPRGRGPYGITVTPTGEVWYASLAGNHIAQIDLKTGSATIVEPPTPGQGARRIWSDSQGKLWISEWNSGQVSVYNPADKSWKQWKLAGARPHAYAVYVDEQDKVWLTDFGANAIVRFDPKTEKFQDFPSDRNAANVRQMLGRKGELWGAESGQDRLVVITYGPTS